MVGGCLQPIALATLAADRAWILFRRTQLRRQETPCRQNGAGSCGSPLALLKGSQKARRAALKTKASSGGNGAGSGGDGGGGGGGGGSGKQAALTTENFKQQMQLLGVLLVRCADHESLVALPAAPGVACSCSSSNPPTPARHPPARPPLTPPHPPSHSLQVPRADGHPCGGVWLLPAY